MADFHRHRTSFCALLFDIDHFKSINDTWGHDVGDQVLCNVAGLIAGQARETDLAVRYGGEEFAMILPATDLAEAFGVAQRICAEIRDADYSRIASDLKVTISGGAAEVNCDEDFRSLMKRADEALYAAKQRGRDRCLVHRDDSIHDSLVASR